jgi:DNA-binding winged helix-turn-helix (wHTH) protein
MPHEGKHFYYFGPYSFNAADRTVLKDGIEVRLSPKAFSMLEVFVTKPGRVISRDELKLSVWGTNHVSDNSVDQKITEIRRQFGTPGDGYIESRHGQGWRFIALLEERTEVEPTRDLAQSELQEAPSSLARAPGDIVDVPATPQTPGRRFLRTWLNQRSAFALAAISLLLVIGTLLRPKPEPRVIGFHQLTDDGRPKVGPLLTDGRLLYFQETTASPDGSTTVVAAVPVSGGDVIFPRTPLTLAIPIDIARNTGQFLLNSYSPLWKEGLLLWNPKNGALRRTVNAIDEQASISPDGRLLAYHDPDGLHILQLSPKPSLTTVRVQGWVQFPRWSIDGSRLRFTVRELVSNNDSLWEVRRDGTHLRALLLGSKGSPSVCCGTWTHNGRYFVFQDTTNAKTNGLWVIRDGLTVNQTQPAHLTNAPMQFQAPRAGRGRLSTLRNRNKITR